MVRACCAHRLRVQAKRRVQRAGTAKRADSKGNGPRRADDEENGQQRGQTAETADRWANGHMTRRAGRGVVGVITLSPAMRRKTNPLHSSQLDQ